jgi:hypothetical protein
MMSLIKKIEKKINGIIWAMVGNGILLVFLGVLIIWTDFFLRFTVGIIVLIIAYMFFYVAHKFWTIKDEIKKQFKID